MAELIARPQRPGRRAGDGRHRSRPLHDAGRGGRVRAGRRRPRSSSEPSDYDRCVSLRGVHHLGFAVTDLDEAIATYDRLFGATLEHRDSVAEQGVDAASVLVGASRIELLAPTGDDTPVGRFLAKRGPGMHHVAYEVDDVAAELGRLAREGAELIDESPRRRPVRPRGRVRPSRRRPRRPDRGGAPCLTNRSASSSPSTAGRPSPRSSLRPLPTPSSVP